MCYIVSEVIGGIQYRKYRIQNRKPHKYKSMDMEIVMTKQTFSICILKCFLYSLYP